MISSGPPRHGRRTVEEVERVSERSPLKRTKSVAPRRCRIREGVDGTTAHGGSRARSKGKERRRRSCWLGASPATQAYVVTATTHTPDREETAKHFLSAVTARGKEPQEESRTKGGPALVLPTLGQVGWVCVVLALLGLHARCWRERMFIKHSFSRQQRAAKLARNGCGGRPFAGASVRTCNIRSGELFEKIFKKAMQPKKRRLSTL